MSNRTVVYRCIIAMQLLILVSCAYDKKELPQPILPADTTLAGCDTITAPTYTNHVKSILETNCTVTGCHDIDAPPGLDYTTYAGIKGKVDEGVFKIRVLDLKDMPQANSPGPDTLDACTLFKLQRWLDNGAPE